MGDAANKEELCFPLLRTAKKNGSRLISESTEHLDWLSALPAGILRGALGTNLFSWPLMVPGENSDDGFATAKVCNSLSLIQLHSQIVDTITAWRDYYKKIANQADRIEMRTVTKCHACNSHVIRNETEKVLAFLPCTASGQPRVLYGNACRGKRVQLKCSPTNSRGLWS